MSDPVTLYLKKNKNVMPTPRQLQVFCRKEKKLTNINNKQAKDLINNYKPPKKNKKGPKNTKNKKDTKNKDKKNGGNKKDKNSKTDKNSKNSKNDKNPKPEKSETTEEVKEPEKPPLEEAKYEVNDEILLTKDRMGVVRYVGPIENVLYYGVELTNGAVGTSDGTCKGERYFQTEGDRAVFVKSDEIRRKMTERDHKRKLSYDLTKQLKETIVETKISSSNETGGDTDVLANENPEEPTEEQTGGDENTEPTTEEQTGDDNNETTEENNDNNEEAPTTEEQGGDDNNETTEEPTEENTEETTEDNNEETKEPEETTEETANDENNDNNNEEAPTTEEQPTDDNNNEETTEETTEVNNEEAPQEENNDENTNENANDNNGDEIGNGYTNISNTDNIYDYIYKQNETLRLELLDLYANPSLNPLINEAFNSLRNVSDNNQQSMLWGGLIQRWKRYL